MIVTIDFRLFSEPKSKKNQNVLFDNCCSRNNRMLHHQPNDRISEWRPWAMGDVDLLVQKAKARFAHEGLRRVYDGYDGQMVRWSPSWPQDVVQSVAVMTSIRVTILGQNGTNFTQQMPYCSSKTDICRWAARILTGDSGQATKIW